VSEERVREIVRQFPENGLKRVLTTAGNLRDLLALAGATMLPRLDFTALQVDPTTYVTAEYRHVTSDLVLTLTLLPTGKGRRRRRLTVSILIELQAQPDRIMLLRVLDYLVQIWKDQVKRHGERQGSRASVKLQPVLPVVLHTGSYRWEGMGTLLDLMDDAEDFRAVTPAFQPLFVSLPDLSEADLESRGGHFGQVLALLRAREIRRGPFAQRLERTVGQVEELTGAERLRRLELLDYIEALVYHSRPASEHSALRERIDTALRHDEDRLEVGMARRTLADVHRDEAILADRKRMLVEQLRLRFESLSPETEQTIRATDDADRLAEWLRRFATAKDLASVGIAPPD
jgi:hypothetical protein